MKYITIIAIVSACCFVPSIWAEDDNVDLINGVFRFERCRLGHKTILKHAYDDVYLFVNEMDYGQGTRYFTLDLDVEDGGERGHAFYHPDTQSYTSHTEVYRHSTSERVKKILDFGRNELKSLRDIRYNKNTLELTVVGNGQCIFKKEVNH